jgi:hypothetical protein
MPLDEIKNIPKIKDSVDWVDLKHFSKEDVIDFLGSPANLLSKLKNMSLEEIKSKIIRLHVITQYVKEKINKEKSRNEEYRE